MAAPAVKIRKRYFLAVEGRSEQSFVAWLQMLSREKLHVHLDAFPLDGGGFKSMLEKAVRFHQRHGRARAYRERFLILDRDRAEQGDWSIQELKRQAAVHKIIVCVQTPNHEGLLLRMMPGMEGEIPEAASAESKLRSYWPSYQKPANAHALQRQFAIEDLLRVARADPDLAVLLKTIGLMD